MGQSVFPNRPVSDIAVDRSNDRIAYAGFNGYNAGTPSRPGHVFATTDGGAHWKNISSNLPDVPVNSLQIDASYPNTLYAGTDVGPFVTYNGGKSWQVLGSGFPTVEVWQLNLDPANRNLAAGTHGRGAWTMHDAATVPALVVGKADPGAPVGPGKDIAYTITVNNIGNADATGVTVSDPIPANTSFKSAGDGGALSGGKATWTGLTVAAGDSITLHLSVTISPSLASSVKSIIDDGLTVTSAQNVGATGSAHVTPIAPAHAVTISPTPQNDGAHVGGSVDYTFHITNSSFNDDSYTLGVASGAFTATVLDATCTTPLTSVSVASGASADVCVHVSVPGGAANAATDTATLTATSVGDPSVSASGTATTTAVAVDVLVVDNDHHGNPPLPDVRSFYTTALTSAGQTFDVADLETNPVLPLGYMKAHKTIVWFTGASYPDPVGPYETNLKAFLDGGGRLLMKRPGHPRPGCRHHRLLQELRPHQLGRHRDPERQADNQRHGRDRQPGHERDRDRPTRPQRPRRSVRGPDHAIAPATAAFTDATAQADGLTVASGAYKVVFLAFPFEAFGTAAQKADLMTRVFTYFNAP